jgi:hypothetical protein
MLNKSMEILFLLFLLQVKHCYADFVIQTYAQTVRKGIYRDLCGISHSLDHVWTTYVCLLIFSIIHPLSGMAILLAGALEGLAHYHIDWAKVRFGSKDQTKPLFWAQFGYDQLAHQSTYIFMIWWLLL